MKLMYFENENVLTYIIRQIMYINNCNVSWHIRYGWYTSNFLGCNLEIKNLFIWKGEINYFYNFLHLPQGSCRKFQSPLSIKQVPHFETYTYIIHAHIYLINFTEYSFPTLIILFPNILLLFYLFIVPSRHYIWKIHQYWWYWKMQFLISNIKKHNTMNGST